MINPTYLRTFMNLVQTRHFTQTAQQLHMTQPGVSQHIKKLEAVLDTPLLNRYGKTFELTTAGDKLYQYGLEQVLAEAELFQNISDDSLYRGECRLACSGSMAMQFFPPLLKLQQQHPELSISIEAAPNSAIVERVRSNQSDLGLITQQIDDSTLLQKQIGEDELCLVLPANHEANWQTLMKLGFINHPDGHHYAAQLLKTNFVDDYQGMEKIKQSGYINQLSQILLPVTLGLGFTVIPRSSLDAFPYPDQICSANLEKPIKERVYMITKRHRELPLRYQLITEIIEYQWH